jgi:hypothetical protein
MVIEAPGAELWFLPAYSPDLNPIEEAFSKVKTLLRTAAARTHEALVVALWTALQAVTSADARGYFRHCGYPRLAQPTSRPLSEAQSMLDYPLGRSGDPLISRTLGAVPYDGWG